MKEPILFRRTVLDKDQPPPTKMLRIARPGIDFIGHCIEFFVTNGKNEWLLQKRSQNCRDEQGRWDFGGGRQELSEDRFTALRREVYEELGFDPKLTHQLPGYTCFRQAIVGEDQVQTHWEVTPYIVMVSPGQPIIWQKEKVDEWGWFPFDHIMAGQPQPFHSAVPFVVKRYYNEFKAYGGCRTPHMKLDPSYTIKTNPMEVDSLDEETWADYANGICETPTCYNARQYGERVCSRCR